MNPTDNMIQLPDSVNEYIAKLQKTEKFCNYSYAEMIQILVKAGLKKTDTPQKEVTTVQNSGRPTISKNDYCDEVFGASVTADKLYALLAVTSSHYFDGGLTCNNKELYLQYAYDSLESLMSLSISLANEIKNTLSPLCRVDIS